MAFTRATLKSIGLTDEQVQAVIDLHTEVTDGLKTTMNGYKADAEKLPEVQKQLEKLQKEDWKAKYETEHTEYEKYKKDITDRDTLNNVKSAYRKLLKDANVGENHLDAIIRVTDFSSMKLKADGTLEDADKLSEAIKKDWSGFVQKQETNGDKPETPPQGGKPTGQSRAAMLEAKYHSNLYGETKEN